MRTWIMAVAMAAMLATGGQAAAQQPILNPGECLDHGKVRKCDGYSLFSMAGMGLQQMWQDENYQGIETQLRAWCDSDEKFPDGQRRLVAFEGAFTSYFSAWNDPQRIQQQLAKWKASGSPSLALALVESIFWTQYAWQARGNGYANTVSPEGWELYRQRMAHATASLRDSKELVGNCALWHSMVLIQMLETSAPRAELAAAYQVAAARFPAYQPIHLAMGRALTPIWGGSDKLFDQFARSVARQTAAIEGNGMYARLYWSRDVGGSQALSFGQGGATPDWKLIRSGFDDLMQRFPDSTWNMNEFASMACRANDKETYLKWRRQLGEVIERSLWLGSYSVDICDYRFHEKA